VSRFNFSLVGDHHHLARRAPPRTEQLRAVGGGVFFLGRAYFYFYFCLVFFLGAIMFTGAKERGGRVAATEPSGTADRKRIK